jgi:hypothetical protein
VESSYPPSNPEATTSPDQDLPLNSPDAADLDLLRLLAADEPEAPAAETATGATTAADQPASPPSPADTAPDQPPSGNPDWRKILSPLELVALFGMVEIDPAPATENGFSNQGGATAPEAGPPEWEAKVTAPEDAASLSQHAESLANWVVRHMLVRRNAYGYYTEYLERTTAKVNLLRRDLIEHFQGKRTIGLFPVSTDNFSKWGTIDIDFHDEKKDNADANWSCALRVVELFATYGLTAHIFESNNNGSYHVRFFIKNRGNNDYLAYVSSRTVYWVCQQVVSALQPEFPAVNMETFPKQSYVTDAHPFGNWIRLFGQHHKTGYWGRVWDSAGQVMLHGGDFTQYILGIEGDDPAPLIARYGEDLALNPPVEQPSRDYEDDGEKPSIDAVRSALDALSAENASDYSDWLGVGMALHSWDYFDGLELWKEFSARCKAKYDGTGQECESKWKGFSSDGSDTITIGSLFYWAYEDGWAGFKPASTSTREIIVGEDGWPALRLGKLPDVPDFPLEVLPDVLQQLVIDASNAANGVDPGMIASSTIAISGGLIGRSAALRMGDNWFSSACVFHANVLWPGNSKTPLLNYIRYPVDVIEERLRDDFTLEREAYEASLEKYEEDKRKKVPGLVKPIRPHATRLLVDDTTFEAMVRVMAENPRGLLSLQDELTSFILSLNQYKGGSGNDRANFLKVWSSSSFLVDRRSNEFGQAVHVPFPFLDMTGNMTPPLLPLMLNKRIDDGLLDRWVYVFPDRKPKLKSNQRGTVSNDLLKAWLEIAEKLYKRSMMETMKNKFRPNVVNFTDRGRAKWNHFYDQHVDECNGSDFSESLLGPWSKLEVYAGRFPLILAFLWDASRPDTKEYRPYVPEVVPRDSVNAWKLIDYYKGHHRRVRAFLDGVGMGSAPEYTRLILNWIKNHPDRTSFSFRDLTQAYPPSRNYDPALFEDALIWLTSRNAIRPKTERKDGEKRKPGRPGTPVYDISPQLREAQQKQQKQQNRGGGSFPLDSDDVDP